MQTPPPPLNGGADVSLVARSPCFSSVVPVSKFQKQKNPTPKKTDRRAGTQYVVPHPTPRVVRDRGIGIGIDEGGPFLNQTKHE